MLLNQRQVRFRDDDTSSAVSGKRNSDAAKKRFAAAALFLLLSSSAPFALSSRRRGPSESDSNVRRAQAEEEGERTTAAADRRPPLSSETKDRASVPTDSDGSPDDDDSPLFHFIFTTSVDTLTTLNLRSIESVFFSYPRARVYVHSNTLNAQNSDVASSPLRPLLRRGYDISFRKYDVVQIMESALRMPGSRVDPRAVKAFVDNLSWRREEKFWYAHESDLLRLFLLYTAGGTYIDTDVVLLKRMDDVDNAVGGGVGKLENSILKFTKPRNTFLAAVINEFLTKYEGGIWGWNGPGAFDRAAKARPGLLCPCVGDDCEDIRRHFNPRGKAGECSANIIPEKLFFPVHYTHWSRECFEPDASPIGKDAMRLIEGSYTVHLNNKITGKALRGGEYREGSVCDIVMRDFCTACPEAPGGTSMANEQMKM